MEQSIGSIWYWLVGIGLLAGILSAALGVGSGVIVVPALALGLGFGQKTAQGTCLAMMVPMALMGALRYYWNPDIKLNWTVVLILIPCAVLGANVGSSVAAWLPAATLRKLFGALMIVVGVRMLWPK
jgi:uncharacterized protein